MTWLFLLAGFWCSTIGTYLGWRDMDGNKGDRLLFALS